MRMFKRSLATVLALLMLVMAVPFGGLAVYAAEDYPTLSLGEIATATVEEAYGIQYYYFTPETSDYYSFYSLADGLDTYGYVYNMNGNELDSNDDGGGNRNFRVVCYLNAGETYRLGAGFWSDNTGSYPVIIDVYAPRTITGLDFHDVSYLQVQIEDRYNLGPTVDVYYSDGSMETNTSAYTIWDELGEYAIQLDYDVPMEEWQADGVYAVHYYVDVNGAIYAGQYNATVEPCPIVSIEFATKYLVENYNGSWEQRQYWDEETEEYVYEDFFRYYDVRPRATITMRDGTVYENVTGFNWDDGWYSFDVDQYMQPLQFGTNRVTGSVLGYDYMLEIEVIDTPIDHIEFQPVSVIEHYSGWWSEGEQWDEEKQEYVPYKYFYYNVYPEATVYMKDGTVYENTTEFVWNDNVYGFGLSDADRRDLPLGTNYLTGVVLGYEYTIEVEVEPSPILSIEVEPCTVIEHSQGYWNEGTYWDSELQQEVPYKYFYYNSLNLSATVTMRDGTVYKGTSFEWNDGWYGLGVEQSRKNQLTLGTNYMTGSVLGYEYTVVVEVVESPVASVTVEPIIRIEYDNGEWESSEYWDDDLQQEVSCEYFHYYDISPSASNNVTITLKDGTVIRGTYFEWDGQGYGVSYNGQGPKNRIELGINERSASIAGYDFTYVIEVVESPVASVVVNPISLVENRDGYWQSGTRWDDELQEYVSYRYFYYYQNNIEPRLTITLKDGTVYENCRGFEWNGRYHSVSVDSQNSSRYLVPGSNTWHGSIAGYAFDYDIQISTLSSNDAFEYMENTDSVIITDCYLSDTTVEIPAEINGKPVIGVASLGNATWSLRNLILPDSVVTIGDYLLSNCDWLESVHFGAGITNLTADMFGYCWNLKSITISEDNPYFCVVNRALHNKALDTFIAYPVANENGEYVVPATVVNIDVLDYYSIYNSIDVTFAENHVAFVSIDGVTYNKEMTKVISCRKDKTGDYVMPETVEEIADGAFMNTKLTSVVVSPKVTEIVYCAFASCASLESVTLPEGLISIEQSAFEQTFALQEINLPDTLEYIGYYSFYKTGLHDLNVPGSVERIDDCAFLSSQVINLTLNEGIQEIGWAAFENTPVRSVVLPNSLTYLGGSAFERCWALSSVHIGSGLTSIEHSTFANTAIATLTLPEGLFEINNHAFYGCDNLVSVHFPATVAYIHGGAFSHCSSLSTLTVAENSKYFFHNGNCIISHDGTLTVACKDSVIPNDGSVTTIGAYVFSDCDSLQEITFPDGLEIIENNAFYDCDGIRSIVIPDSVRKIYGSAFAQMDNLQSAQLGDGLEFIGGSVFAGSALTDVDLGNSLTAVAAGAFAQTNLQEVFIPSSVTDIMYESFWYCESLTSIELPITVETIQENAFRGCYKLTDVYYQGTEADRDAMYIEEWGNECLLGANWHYEWTNENWAPIPACDHEYDNNCDEECNLCGRPRTALHEYDNVCDEFCNICGDWRAVGDHEYDNGCDAFCNICGAERWIEGHWYDNACDIECNECGDWRVTEDHWYDNACDAACNECGATRVVGEHVYDSKYDADCNECGAYRETSGPVKFSVESTHARPGDTFSVSVRIDNNSGLVGFRFNVFFDDSRFELMDAVAGSDFASATFGPAQSPFSVLWIEADKPENTANGDIVVLTFRVKEGAALGESEISVVPYLDDVLDGNLDVVPVESNPGFIELTESIAGDADGDGAVNMQDLGLLMRHLTGWDVEVDTSALDVNRDGKVNNRDFALIQRYLNGWDVELY